MSDGARVTRNFTLTGTWTPVLTFSTPGNLSVAYTTQTGRYVKIGSLVFIEVHILTSTFTHTTASGTLRVTGLPFAANASSPFGIVACSFSGYTKANFTWITGYVSGSVLLFSSAGSGQSSADLVVADMPTGGTVIILASGSYTT